MSKIDVTLNDYIQRILNKELMNKNISSLIASAGFSSTYEKERLTTLCQLVATHCIRVYESSDSNDLAKIIITNEFDIK